MKKIMISDFSPYFNESLISKIKIIENKEWMNSMYIVESNKSFSYESKEYEFSYPNDDFIKYIQIDGSKCFTKSRLRIKRNYPFFKVSADKWKNESIQRNFLLKNIKPKQDDILILSDIDEIIDPIHRDYIINNVNKYGIITIKLVFTMFYFNLVVKNWGGPADYSYRVFIMTGDYYNNKLNYTSDQLRKLGEAGKLYGTVKCLDENCGFHHSWVGDQDFIKKKINSYAHSKSDHDPRLFNLDGSIDGEFIKECLLSKKSIFGDEYKLEVDPKLKYLKSVDSIKKNFSDYFID